MRATPSIFWTDRVVRTTRWARLLPGSAGEVRRVFPHRDFGSGVRHPPLRLGCRVNRRCDPLSPLCRKAPCHGPGKAADTGAGSPTRTANPIQKIATLFQACERGLAKKFLAREISIEEEADPLQGYSFGRAIAV